MAGGTAAAQAAYNNGLLFLGDYPAGRHGQQRLEQRGHSCRQDRLDAAIPTTGLVFGQWGANTTDAWVVLPGSSINTNQFAVVPEPGTIALLVTGCLIAVPVIRRRLKKSKK